MGGLRWPPPRKAGADASNGILCRNPVPPPERCSPAETSYGLVLDVDRTALRCWEGFKAKVDLLGGLPQVGRRTKKGAEKRMR